MVINLVSLITALPQGTCVRVKLEGNETIISGDIGPFKRTVRLYDKIRNTFKMREDELTVIAIHPLFHAQEIYIECVNLKDY